MKVADIISRNPVQESDKNNRSTLCETAITSYACHQAERTTAVDWRSVQQQASHDQECIGLSQAIKNGFSETKTELPTELQPYWSMKDDLYTVSGIPFKGKKMLIPKTLCSIVLEGLLAALQGVNDMLANARKRFFWPGLDASIYLHRAQYRQCNEQVSSQLKEPAVESIQPEVPFEEVTADFCKISSFSYLIYVDAYSGWIEVANLTGTGFHPVKEMLLMYFVIFVVPEEIGTDGGPQFNSGYYINLLKKWNIRRRLSSAYYPQSNGRAEVSLKTAKHILHGNINPRTEKLDNDKAVKALLADRNTPCQQTGTSLNVTLFRKPIRDHLPIPNLKLQQEWQEIADKREEALAKRHLV